MQDANPSSVRERLDRDPAVIYALDSDLRITYCNEAWDRFAAENGGKGLGRQKQLGRLVWDVIPDALLPFFQQGYGSVLTFRKPWEHQYECSSPTVFRSFRMKAYPDPEHEGLVVVNSLVVERPHQRLSHAPGTSAYVDARGHVTMCCECRRTRRVKEPTIWDWVPAYLQQRPEFVTHGLCMACLTLLYPAFAPDGL
jgi:hypothetical protein